MVNQSYNIRVERDARGWLYDAEDVFRVAFPFASSDVIARLMMEYNAKKTDGYRTLKAGYRGNGNIV